MKKKRFLAFLLSFALMMPTISVAAEEYEPTTAEISAEVPAEKPIIEEIVAEEPVMEETAAEESLEETEDEPAEKEEDELVLMAEESYFTWSTFLPLLVEELELDHLDVSELENPFSGIDEEDDCYQAAMVCYYMGWRSSIPSQITTKMTFYYAIEILYAAGQVGTPKAPPTTFITSSDELYDKACAVYGAGLLNVTEDDYYGEKIFPSNLNTEKLVPIEKNADMNNSAHQLDLSDGPITVTSGYKGIYYTQNGETYGTLKGCAIRQTNSTAAATENTITITETDPFCDVPVKLTIANLNVSAKTSPIDLKDNAEVELNLAGVSTLTSSGSAGIHVAEGTSLTIGGTGEVTATGGRSAGIGGLSNIYGGIITINDGTITANGDSPAAGICGSITINGGTVTANGGESGAGIGGGVYRDGIITINGGTITANGGKNGAGIGGGEYGNGGIITINGGTVSATGGEGRYSDGNSGGAGIGGGDDGDGGSITINGGNVTANGSGNSAGIGSGTSGDGGIITINGGTVTANGGDVGIGGDYSGGTVSISNATVTASGRYHAIGGTSTENEYGCDAITIVNSEMTVSHSEPNGCDYHEKIFIDKQPVSSAALTNNLQIPVEALGNSGLSYQWESSADNSTWTAIEGQTNAALNVPLSHGMYYRCKLTNGWGNSIYTDTVQGMTLAFSQQPESVVTNLDEMICLVATSTCDNVTYQWQKSLNGTNWTDMKNENASSLFLNATLSENGAYYRCVITANNGDTLASDAALISVDSNAVTYTTQFYLEKADGSGYELAEQAVTASESGASVTAAEREFEHFTENTAKGKHSGTVAADNSLVLSRYYDRCTYEITFDMNGGSDLGSIEAKYGAPVSAPMNPTRYGYVFEGWYADKALTEPFGFTTMPAGGTTVYAKWSLYGAERGIEYKFNSISLLDPDTYGKLTSIPKKVFNAEISIQNLSSTSMDTLMLVAYDADGKMVSLHYMYSNSVVGSTTIMGVSIDNSKGQIARLKAFMVPILGGFVPLAKDISFDSKA